MPAPAVRLRAEFSDILGEVWQLNIHDSNYSGSIVSFNVGGDAYQLRYEGNNEDRHQPVIGSSLEFSIIENSASITTFLDELPTTFEGELTVTLRYLPDTVNTLYWAGIILPEQVVRKDEAYPQEVRIIASDDLANLVGIKFNNNGDAYEYSDGRTFRENIVKHCLGKLRTIDHWGATDIFASLDCAYTPSNLYATGADFFSKLRVNTETWLNPDNEGAIEFFNTFEVLESFCRVLNARLFLANGRFWMIPIVSHHDSQTLSYFNYYSDASYTSSSSADVGLTLQTDIIKEAGWEYTHQLPLKEVRRTYKFSGQQSIIGVQEHLEADFGTDLFNLPDYTFASGTKFRVTFDNSHFMTGQGGNNQLARVDLIVLLKVGAYYAKWVHTYSAGSAGYYYDFLSSHYITQYGEPTWTTTNTDRTYVRIRNVNKNTGQAYPSIDPLGMIGNLPNEFTTGELPVEANGIQMRVGFQVLNTNGTVNTTWTNATNVNLYNVKVYIEGSDGDTIDYLATNALSARANLDNGEVLLGSIDSDQARGLIFVQTGASTHSKTETWSSTTFSGAYDINELGVQEILRGQKYPLLLERGTLYANNVGTLLHMYNVVLSDSRRMGIYQYTYNGRMRNYDIELFHITGNATDVSVVPKPPKILNPPVAPAAGSFPGVIDEAANAKYLVDTLDATVTGLSVRLERIYDTFQPVDDDTHTVTKIVYQENATTGMSVTLEELTAQITSDSGNTYLSVGESSPGQVRVFVQDDATPTPNSVGAMFITAASNAGKVGINTSTPAEALDVVGNIAVSGSVDGVDISTLNTVATKDVPVYNNTASTITKGTIVRESGAQSTTGELRIAAFNSLLSVDAHRILGVMTEDIAAGASGYARAVGHVRGLNTNSFTVGTLLYASATTAGAWTSALPTAFNSYAQIIGWVTKQNATTGEIYVRIVPATTLENLANVKDQPPSVGQVLVYDGSVWAGTTQATYSSIGIPGATPPAGGFKSVWFQDSAGNMTYDEAFTYDTSTNTLEIDGTATTAGVLRLGEATNNGTNYVGIQAPATLAANTTYTLPSADGTSGQLLSTNGSGTLSWASANGNTFQTIAVAGQSSVVADSTTDTLTLVAGTNVTITTNATTDTITINASGGGTPAGSTGQIQYNNAGAFGAEAALHYDATNNRLSVGGNTSPGGAMVARGAGVGTGKIYVGENSAGTERFTVQDDGQVRIIEHSTLTSDTTPTLSLTSSVAGDFRSSLSFRNTNITTPFAGFPGAIDTSTAGWMRILDANNGGFQVTGVTENNLSVSHGLLLSGYIGYSAPTVSAVRLAAAKNNAGSIQALASTEPVLTVTNLSTAVITVLGSRAVGIGVSPTSTTCLQVRGQGTGTNETLRIENSGGTARFVVRDDGAYAFAGGTVGAAQTGYTTFTNLTTDRTCDANATTVDELADILGTLIVDLKTKGIISA